MDSELHLPFHRHSAPMARRLTLKGSASATLMFAAGFTVCLLGSGVLKHPSLGGMSQTPYAPSLALVHSAIQAAAKTTNEAADKAPSTSALFQSMLSETDGTCATDERAAERFRAESLVLADYGITSECFVSCNVIVMSILMWPRPNAETWNAALVFNTRVEPAGSATCTSSLSTLPAQNVTFVLTCSRLPGFVGSASIVLSTGHGELHGELGPLETTSRGPDVVQPRDCTGQLDGAMLIRPDGAAPFQVQCRGGWAVMQQRTGPSDFHRGWDDYLVGFGDEHNFWLGNANLHRLMWNGGRLRVELVDWTGSHGFAEYGHFEVAGALQGFRASVTGYSGNIGDALSAHSQGMSIDGNRFATKDHDHNGCVALYPSGWWMNNCFAGNLNGVYLSPGADKDQIGITWEAWYSNDRSMNSSRMMVKPAP